ncbi:hypothetical protein [Pseudorhodoplanes sp.]|uniref:hypothetical protein n=1 Tax=Pseudorhodoplanes sp. TaxID=1934341 RepID=UPI002C801639|nr:hypothetical protein [Pseudorhodoplanes sp.]HWV44005.1 hypothetical protein [Pseudorhodoplanes sp.]
MIRRETLKSQPSSPPPAQPAGNAAADFSAFAHLGLWGGVAASCLLVVALATRTETAQARLAAAYAYFTGHSEAEDRQAKERRRQIEDARRMSEAIRSLTEDRDRLIARMAVIERNYEDVTGSIGKLAAARPAAETPAPSPSATAVVATPSTPPPAVAAPASVPAQSSASAVFAHAAVEPQQPVAVKSAFGVDIGGGQSLNVLRNAWDRARRNHAALLDGLQPVIAVRDGRGGHVELRLVAGPIANAADAARLCASLAAAGLSCQPTIYDGQRLALR